MASDVLITPSSGLIQFSSSVGSGSGQIKVDGDDLVISNVLGDVLLGDGASDVFIGDGTNNVDIVFEQNGEIRDDGSGKNIIFGSKTTNVFISGSTAVALQSGGGNVGIGAATATKELQVTGDISASGELKVESHITASGNISSSVDSTGSFGAGFFDNKVGIGTTSPDHPLHIKYDNSSDEDDIKNNTGFVGLQIENTNASGVAAIHLRSSDSDGYILYDDNGSNAGDFHFKSDEQDSDSVLVIKSDGKTGIGTESPTETLEIKAGGRIKVTPASDATGSILSLANDQDVLLSSQNDSATGDPQQFVLKHNAGATELINRRGNLILSASGDLTLDAVGDDIIFKDAGSTRFVFNLDTSPEIDVTGDFTIDGSGDIKLDSATSVVDLVGHITSSGNISSSGNILTSNNITALGTITAGRITSTGAITSSTDISASGIITGLSASLSSINLADDDIINIGTGNDLKIFHDATDSIITNATGDLKITSTGDDVIIQGADDVDILVQGGETAAKFGGNGGVDLYHNNAKKFGTGADGISAVGSFFATANITASGNIKAGGNVAIGMPNPTRLLQISQSANSGFDTTVQLSGQHGSVGDGNAIFFKTSPNETDDRYGVKLGGIRGTSDNGAAVFKIELEKDLTGDGPDGLSEVFRIDERGNAGLGTDSPTEPLQVAGNISSSGHFFTELSASIGGNNNLTGSGKALTVEGDISASGEIVADAFKVEGNTALNVVGDKVTFGQHIGDLQIGKNTTQTTLTIAAHITASGEISASSTITSQTGFVGQVQATGSYDFPGAIMGYTDIGSNSGHAAYTITTSFAVPDSEMNVVFVVPKSGKIEIMVQVQVKDNSTSGNTITCGLSDDASYSSIGAQHEVASFFQDETGTDVKTIRWSIEGLNPGSTLQYWFAVKASLGSTSQTLQWGGNSANRFPDFIMKATALPSNAVFL